MSEPILLTVTQAAVDQFRTAAKENDHTDQALRVAGGVRTGGLSCAAGVYYRMSYNGDASRNGLTSWI